MSRLPFDRNINPYFAFFAITVVGSGAALAIDKLITLTSFFTTYSAIISAQ